MGRSRAALIEIAASLVLALAVGIAHPGASAAARPASTASGAGANHVVATDADVYVDVLGLLPPEYVMVTDDRDGFVVTRSYEASGGFEVVNINFALGHGERVQSLADEALHDPLPYLDDEIMGALAEDTELPRDQLVARNGPWTPVDVGDRALISENAVEIADQGSISFDVIRFVASWRDNVAVGEVMSIHVDPAGVDAVPVARAIAARVAAGPPSPHERVAAAGLVRGADLPGEWHVEPATETGATPTGGAGDGGSADAEADEDVARDEARDEAVADAAARSRACTSYGGAVEAALATGGGTASGGAAGTGDEGHAVGPRFRSGLDSVQSTVWRTNERAARAAFLELHRPVFMKCLRSVYAAAVEASIEAADIDATVAVTVDDLPAVGDDALLATVRVDLANGRHLITEVVFVRVRGAQGVYAFATTSDSTVRSSVLAAVVERLDAAV